MILRLWSSGRLFYDVELRYFECTLIYVCLLSRGSATGVGSADVVLSAEVDGRGRLFGSAVKNFEFTVNSKPAVVIMSESKSVKTGRLLSTC